MNSKIDEATIERKYDRAISLMKYQTELLWKEFEAFLLAETVLIGFLGTTLTKEEAFTGKNIPVFLGAILGLIICIPWLSTFLHTYEFYNLRMAQAKRHEEEFGFELLTEGKILSSGKTIVIDGKEFHHAWLARILPPRRAVVLLHSPY
jgi:lysylphosphatidylglycerol synthetase-like protein (DUF2156 family)